MRDHLYYLISCRAGLPPIFVKMDWCWTSRRSRCRNRATRCPSGSPRGFSATSRRTSTTKSPRSVRSTTTSPLAAGARSGSIGRSARAPRASARPPRLLWTTSTRRCQTPIADAELAEKLAKLPSSLLDYEEGLGTPVASEDKDSSVNSGDEDLEGVPGATNFRH
ncbi:hypothetical protein DL770_011040 [Monosporascus sp. CRB-9-2]|nr:hypothetical protein DL770_011040 [Monosporascus sp. CRB-9-2]